MADLQRVGGLEIDQDLGFQERMWSVQRIGRAAFALIILAAALGLFGPGILSAAVAEQGALRVAYNRFERFKTSTSLNVHVAPGAASGATVELWLARGYLQHVQIDGVTPEPQEVRDGDGRVTYVFALDEAGAPAWITVHLTPRRPGPLTAQVGVSDGEQVQFTQLVYP